MSLSRNTVSLALNDNAMVADETKRLVVKCAIEMGYKKIPEKWLQGRNFQQVITQKSKPVKILVIRRNDKAVFWDKIIYGISEEASKNNCILCMAVIPLEDELELQLPQGLEDDVDMIVFLNIFSKDYVQLLYDLGHPCMFFDISDELSIPSLLGDVIISEGRNSMRLVTRHLLAQGLKKFAFIGDYSCNSTSVRDRYCGYCDALEEAEIYNDTEYVSLNQGEGINYYDEDVLLNILMSYPEMPEAIVCANDSIARVVVKLLRKLDYQIPSQVAVTGFDNDDDNYVEPFITSVGVDSRYLGSRFIQQIFWRKAHPEAQFETVIIQSKVYYRKSSTRIK